MAEYIECYTCNPTRCDGCNIHILAKMLHAGKLDRLMDDHHTIIETADVAPVVRCQNCIHAEPLDRNCELNGSVYMHCKLWRGEEEKNVWHKYKKYYKDYSLVERDWFCSSGERMDGE